jgi:hypothetical protein
LKKRKQNKLHVWKGDKDKDSTSFALIEEMETTQASHLERKRSHHNCTKAWIFVFGEETTTPQPIHVWRRKKTVLGPKPSQ